MVWNVWEFVFELELELRRSEVVVVVGASPEKKEL
jgi:hypothetical protein